jgi:hypothetical protein
VYYDPSRPGSARLVPPVSRKPLAMLLALAGLVLMALQAWPALQP